MDTTREEHAIREAAPAYIEIVPDAAPAYECPPAYEQRSIRDRIQQSAFEREELLMELAATGFDPELYAQHRRKARALEEKVREGRARLNAATREAEAERKLQDRSHSSFRALAKRLRYKGSDAPPLPRRDTMGSEDEDDLSTVRSYSGSVVRGFEARHDLQQLEASHREAQDALLRLKATELVHERVYMQLQPVYGRIFDTGLRSKPRQALSMLRSEVETAQCRTRLAGHRAKIEEAVLRDLQRTYILLRRTTPDLGELLVASQTQGWAMGNTFANMDSQMEQVLDNVAVVNQMIEQIREQQNEVIATKVVIDTKGTKPRAVIRRCSWDSSFYRRMNEARRRLLLTQQALAVEIQNAKARKFEAEEKCITAAKNVSTAKLELLWRHERLIEQLMRGESEWYPG